MMTKYLFILSFLFQLSAFAENIQGREIPNNGEFFQDENLWKSYYADNLKRLDRALNRKNIVFDTCPSKKLPDNSNDRTNIVNALSNIMGKFEFLKLNTEIFYSKSDRLKCDMDVTLLKQNFPEHLRKSDDDLIYWTNELIAQRWKVSSLALKKCSIKVKTLTLTTFEFQGDFRDREPSYNLSTGAKNLLIKPFRTNNDLQEQKTAIFAYVKSLSTQSSKNKRGDANYGTAFTLGLNPNLKIEPAIWMSRDAMMEPIMAEGVSPQDSGYVTESHELYHFLTGEENEEAHEHTRENPDNYNPMSDLFLRRSGTFTEEQCKKMREIGQQRGLLRCSDQYAKAGSNSKNP